MEAKLYLFKDFDKNLETHIAIGNFDGVHKGHQALIRQMLDQCESDNSQSIVVTFTPNTKALLRNDFQLVQSYQDRRNRLETQKVDGVLEIEFVQDVANLEAKTFLSCLKEYLNISNIFVGSDFRFGKNGAGNLQLLQEYFGDSQIKISKLLLESNLKYSSGTLRAALQEPNLNRYKELSGSNYTISGKIVGGKQLGRSIGYPTINIDLEPLSLCYGVYIVIAYIDQDKSYGIANFGVAPTLHQERGNCLEVHFPDQNIDLYGKHAEVEFLKFLRIEKKFTDKKYLLEAISNDLDSFRTYLLNVADK